MIPDTKILDQRIRNDLLKVGKLIVFREKSNIEGVMPPFVMFFGLK